MEAGERVSQEGIERDVRKKEEEGVRASIRQVREWCGRREASHVSKGIAYEKVRTAKLWLQCKVDVHATAVALALRSLLIASAAATVVATRVVAVVGGVVVAVLANKASYKFSWLFVATPPTHTYVAVWLK